MTGTARSRAGLSALIIMWSMILVTVVFAATATWLRILLIAVGLTGTIVKMKYFFGKTRNHITRNR
jgi:uncharacterized membrane protein YuzA (DUF378 family)